MNSKFQLTALAIALSASGTVLAGVSINGGPELGPVNSAVISVDGLPAGSSVSTVINSTGVNVNAQNNVTTNTSNPTQGSTLSIPSIGTPNTTQAILYEDNYSQNATQTQNSQVYSPEKIEFTSANVSGVENRVVSKSADAVYDANGEFSGSNNVQTLGDTGFVFDNATATVNSQDSIVVGKENSGDDNALTVRKTTTTGSTATSVTANGITLDDGSNVVTMNASSINVDRNNIAANTAAIAQEVSDRQMADQGLQNNIDINTAAIAQEVSDRQMADQGLQNNIDAEAATRATADTALNSRVDQEVADRTMAVANEAAARQSGDTAIRNDIATKVTTNELEVNGPSTFNGPVTVNNVQSSVVNAQPTVAGKDIVVPTVNQPWANTTQTISSERVDSQEQTRNETKQVYNKDLLQFSSAIVEGTLETTTSQTATATYDANGVIVPGSLQGPTLGQPTSEFKEKSTSSIQEVALGRKDINDDLSLTVTKTANGKTSTSSLSATGISTSRINGNGTNGALVLHGGTNSTTQTLDDNGVTFVTTDAGGMVTGTTTIGADGTLTVKGVDVTQAIDTATTDRAAIRTEFAAADVTLQNNIDAEAATRAAADTAATTDRGAIRSEFAAADTAIRSEMATETVRVNNAIASGDAATLASANANTATTATAIRGEAATEKTRVNGQLAAATTDRAAIRTEFAAADTAIRGEMATETTRVNKAMSDGNSATLAAANANTATTATAIRSEMTAGNASTLASANKYTDGRVNQLRSKLDDVEQTAYRGVAIALAAQQAIPNLKPGNVAVFGGVGHYEGETAGALGLATLLGDGRTSLSAALGFAESQIGGRVGVSYVFGD